MSKITIERSVVEQALEALTCTGEHDDPGHRCTHCDDYVDRNSPARAALRAALEQPQVEQSSVVGVIGWKNHLPNSGTVVHWTALMPPLGTKLYIHPQTKRQPLTDDEINTIWRNSTHMTIVEVVRDIEAAHGIKEQK